MSNCVICIDAENNGELCQPLKSVVSSDTCGCDYSIHPSCLNEWMTKKDFKCLICGGHLEYKTSALYNVLRKIFSWIFICFIANAGLVMVMYILVVIATSIFVEFG